MREILVVGNGGREHAISQALAKSDDVSRIHQLDPNAGMADIPKAVNHYGISAASTNEIVALAKENGLFTIVGPEAPLVAGLADRLRAEGLLVFGPSQEAAQLESSKTYALELAREVGIDIPDSFATSEIEEAKKYINDHRADDYVIKADGLAGGKGVILPKTTREALEVVTAMLSGEMFGPGGEMIVLQKRLHGPEISALTITDGSRFVHLPLSQDHKRLLDGDEGPNTGWMGAYAPVRGPIINALQHQKIQQHMENAVIGMKRRGVSFSGVLYGGFMLAREYAGIPHLMEFNVRFGDPEIQAILSLLQETGTDIYELLHSAARGNLKEDSIPDIGKTALTVCLAAAGYPKKPRTDDEIFGLGEVYEGVTIQHAGTAQKPDGTIVSSGGRVLNVTGVGKPANEAGSNAYSAIGEGKGVYFKDMHYRTDIGHQIRRP